MKKVLREQISRQKKLMNISEQNSDNLYDYIVGGLKNIFSPEEEKPKPKPKPVLQKINFAEIFKNIIEKIEGGYYHPNMLEDGRIKNKGRMGKSGETMFGIDRKTGGKINETPSGLQYWEIIDKAGASKRWPYNYRGGTTQSRLTLLAIKMIESDYERFSQGYLIAPAKKIVDSNKGLMYHFGYAAWNGEGWFQGFAKSINNEVSRGITNPDKLLKKGLMERKNSSVRLISDSAEKLDSIIGSNMI